MRRDVYFNCGDVLFLSGGRHLQNEMYILSEKMYISIGEMYLKYTSLQLKYTSLYLKYTSLLISCFGTNGLPYLLDAFL